MSEEAILEKNETSEKEALEKNNTREKSDLLNMEMPPKESLAETLENMIDRAEAVTDLIAKSTLDEETERKIEKRFSITKAAELVGRSSQAIRKYENSGALPKPKIENGRRVGYTLAEINNIRRFFKIKVGRLPTEMAIIMSFGNFKGGAGKTTACCHFAQYMAMQGYRVLLIDVDSQASSTTTFGIRPQDIEQEDTVYPCLVGEADSLAPVIRKTHWDQLDIIPACLDLYGAEYQLASESGSNSEREWIDSLKNGIETIKDSYDVIIIDAPPALGMISLNVLKALNGLIVPAPAAMIDFHSTVTYLNMLYEVMTVINPNIKDGTQFEFFKIMLSKYDSQMQSQKFVGKLTAQQFAPHMLESWFLSSAEIGNASGHWKTVYELDKPVGSARTYNRCIESLNAVFSEVEKEIRMTWPSNAEAMREHTDIHL